MNWVSITGQVWGEAEASKCSQTGSLAFVVGGLRGGSQCDFQDC